MTKIHALSFAELRTTFRYEYGKLFRFRRGLAWREVDISKANSGNGYVQVKFKGKVLKAHRVIYSLFYGVDVPTEMQIDHANGIKHDNRICNINLTTHRVNCQNQKRHREGKLVGAQWHKHAKRWQSQISINGKNKSLGSFDTEIEAHQAYLNALGKFEFNEKVHPEEFRTTEGEE